MDVPPPTPPPPDKDKEEADSPEEDSPARVVRLLRKRGIDIDPLDEEREEKQSRTLRLDADVQEVKRLLEEPFGLLL